MMHAPRFLAPLALLAVVLPGCGSGDDGGGSFSAVSAANATRDKGTAHVTMQMRMNGSGLPQDLEITAEGVMALGEPKGRMVMDLGELLEIAGSTPADGDLELVFDGGSLYIDPPEIEGLSLPGGGGWLAVELRPVVEALGIDPDAAGAIFTVDPASQLRALQEAGLEETGTEEIGGVETTHYEGSVSIDDILAALPPEREEKAREALEQLGSATGEEIAIDTEQPMELWVDGDSIVRRMRSSSTIPGQNGAPDGKMDMTYELSDFGAKLDVSRPKDATDVTGKIVDLMGGASKG